MGVGGFDFMFSVFPVIFAIAFVAILGFFAVTIVRGIVTWGKNNNSPKIPVEARIVAKRLNVRGGMHGAASHDHMHNSRSFYYVTFEFSTGDRKEFELSGNEYGLLAEGDIGVLTFQGTRYISFERKI